MPTAEFERMIKDSKGSKICLGIHLDLLNCFIIDDQIYLPQESEETKNVGSEGRLVVLFSLTPPSSWETLNKLFGFSVPQFPQL